MLSGVGAFACIFTCLRRGRLWFVRTPGSARADEARIFHPRYEAFSGVDALSNSIFGYVGGAWALGRDVRGVGPRIKVMLGCGRHDYTSMLPGTGGTITFNGDVVLAPVLAGYLWRRGD